MQCVCTSSLRRLNHRKLGTSRRGRNRTLSFGCFRAQGFASTRQTTSPTLLTDKDGDPLQFVSLSRGSKRWFYRRKRQHGKRDVMQCQVVSIRVGITRNLCWAIAPPHQTSVADLNDRVHPLANDLSSLVEPLLAPCCCFVCSLCFP